MSMYNLLFGKNPNSEIVLALLGLKENDIERFRDCGIEYDTKSIFIYTRTGGGNRDDYPNEILTSNPNYLYDKDDDFDSTYATYYFKFPPEIASEIECLKDVRSKGIPAKLISKVVETIERPETENDKFTKIYEKQRKVYSDLRFNLEVYETNGHTIVPLSDDAMDRLLKAAEENDYPGREGEFLPYSISPYKLYFEHEVPKWHSESEKDNLCRLKIHLGEKWEIDQTIWKRYLEKFKGKYPKAIAKLEDDIS